MFQIEAVRCTSHLSDSELESIAKAFWNHWHCRWFSVYKKARSTELRNKRKEYEQSKARAEKLEQIMQRLY